MRLLLLRFLGTPLLLLSITGCSLYLSDAKKFFEEDGVEFFLGEFLDTTSTKITETSPAQNSICQEINKLSLLEVGQTRLGQSCVFRSEKKHRIFCLIFESLDYENQQTLISEQIKVDFQVVETNDFISFTWLNDQKQLVVGRLNHNSTFCTLSPFDQSTETNDYLDHALKSFN